MAVKGADGALFIDANTLVYANVLEAPLHKNALAAITTAFEDGSLDQPPSDPVVSSHLDPATGLWRSAETNSFDPVKPVSGTIQCTDDNRVVTEKL